MNRTSPLLDGDAAEPTEPYRWYQLGKSALESRRHADARTAFAKACELVAAHSSSTPLPYARDLYASTARLLIALGSPAEALAAAETGSRNFPASPDIAFFHGQALLELGRGTEARDKFELVLRNRQSVLEPGMLALAEEAVRVSAPRHSAACLIQNDFIAVRPCRHGTFMYNRHDTFIGRSLEMYGEWCDAELRLLIPLLRPGMCVVDVGANIGTHTVPLARQVGEAGRVIAIEPQGFVHQMLSGNVALNALNNVTTLRAAAGATLGSIAISQLDPRQACNFGAIAVGAGRDMVPLITIDSLALGACHLIKVDVEGMEAAVLEGAAKTITRFKPMLFLENDRVETSRQLLSAIAAIGYSAYWHIAPYFDASNFYGETENVFARFQPEANIVALPPDVPTRGLLPVSGLDDDWMQAAQRMLQARHTPII